MYRTSKQQDRWFIQIENKESCFLQSISLLCNKEKEIISCSEDKRKDSNHPLFHSCYCCLQNVPLNKKWYLCKAYNKSTN